MQACDLKQDCMTWPHKPDEMCLREVKDVVNKCHLRKALKCGHACLYRRARRGKKAWCAKCEQEASDAPV